MEKQRLDHIQKKATGFIHEGVRILKGSFKEARRLMNATADATKLHLEKESHVIGIHRDYHRLGVELYNQLSKNPNRTQFDISETMRDIVKRIRDAEKEISVSQERLEHMTVVREDKEEDEDTTRPIPRRRKRSGGKTQKGGIKT
jgi:hypothetical protein